MERRFIIFIILSFGILSAYSYLMPKPKRPAPPVEQPAEVEKPAEKDAKPAEETKELVQKEEGEAEQTPPAAPEIQAAPEADEPEQWVALGSASDADPYRMLVTLTNRGAAVERIELSSPRYRDIDDRRGYLGYLQIDQTANVEGCLVQLVGPGTPAAEAGLLPGDIIQAINDKPIAGQADLEFALSKTKPKQPAELEVMRKGEKLTLAATLRRCPLEVIQPENDDPLSMLLTLQQFDHQKLRSDEPKVEGDEEETKRQHDKFISEELDGVQLRGATWKTIASDATHVQFRRSLPAKGLEITKTYRLAQVPEESLADVDFPAYHLEFEIEIRNIGGETHKVAYRLDGPNGLPTEGAWYASKVSRNWGGGGLRDVVFSFDHNTPGMIGTMAIADGKMPPPWNEENRLLTFVGIDAQYFSAVLMPMREKTDKAWFDEIAPIRVGKINKQRKNLTNTSCRLIGAVRELAPGESMANKFRLFAGPKKAAILEKPEYRLGELIYYGWPIFTWFAVPLTAILHWFYLMVHNYGVAIILLTVLVRGCMFPLSLKQVAGAQKMQLLQPEIKKIQEKHKSNYEARTKAQQELFRKHNYNPLSGCLPIFIQMPVFIGLYRALMVSIELRDAPLISNSIRWCSNLAAPDMLYYWGWFMPDWVNSGVGVFGLGPYFNLLPILTIFLFIFQQKMFMPPPTDEQSAMQQKIMQYMMIFMGLMFFKVASGLCIYFIASSLWGLAERRFLPKAPTPATEPETRAQAKERERLALKGKKV